MTATLNTIRATHALATIPSWGLWHAEVNLDGEHTLSGEAKLILADLTLVGTVLSGGPESGRTPVWIVGGRGGWGRVIPEKSYANDAGVKVATILRDAAAACGETLDEASLPTTRVGPAWVRPAGRASRTLALVASKNWYVREDGVTVIGQRKASTLDAKVTRGPVDKARGKVTLAAESIAKILPGLVVDGLSAVDVQHDVSPDGGVRSTVWGARGGTSRRLDALAEILAQLDPSAPYRGVSEYRVESLTGDRFNLTPVRVSSTMPDLGRVVARPGLPGCKGAAKLGSRVLVGFVDSDPARPYVAGYEDADGSGFLPTTLTLVGGTLGVARMTDPIQAGPFAGSIIGASTKVKAG
jgi:hypothetical protein